MDPFCYLRFVSVIECDLFLCFVTFPSGVLGQVWYLIVSIPGLCLLPYFGNLMDIT